MKSIDGRNNVKIYNLSSGKSLPDWLSSKKRRKLLKRNEDMQMKIELIQDFTMPDICNRVKVSEDGQYIIATGTYKPIMKCFDVSALSLKFSRGLDADVVEVLLFSEDYRKMVFLQEERYIEFHNQSGSWFRTRIPKFGRDMAYHYPSCDLYIGASGNEVYRMDLKEGRFGNSLVIGSPTEHHSVSKCLFNPVHYLFTVGTNRGIVEAWDPRSRQRVATLDCSVSISHEIGGFPLYKSEKELAITSLAYKDSLNLAVGTYTGQVLLYDIRSMKPYLVKNKYYDSPIIDLEFHPTQDIVYSLSRDSLNIWDSNTGKSFTCIESDVKYNDLCTIPGSGMVFLAAESSKIEVYFIPSLGPAPKWCGHLDALVEELEEEDIPASYDDYKFVTENELNFLGLDSLIGTKCLKAVMHGYYMDAKLYNKAKTAVNLLDKESLVKQKVKQKIAEQKEKSKKRKKESKLLPNINQESYKKLKDEAEKEGGEKALIAKDLLQDSRFAAMFTKSEFNIDKETESYRLIQPLGGKTNDRYKQIDDSDYEDENENSKTPIEKEEEALSSDSDSIVSDIENEISEEEEEEKPVKLESSKKKLKKRKEIHRSNPESTNFPSKSFTAESQGFRSADSLAELTQKWGTSMKTLSLGELLENEDAEEDTVQEHSYGSREMKFTSDKPVNKFKALRKQQTEHQKHRNTVVRKTKDKTKMKTNKFGF